MSSDISLMRRNFDDKYSFGDIIPATTAKQIMGVSGEDVWQKPGATVIAYRSHSRRYLLGFVDDKTGNTFRAVNFGSKGTEMIDKSHIYTIKDINEVSASSNLQDINVLFLQELVEDQQMPTHEKVLSWGDKTRVRVTFPIDEKEAIIQGSYEANTSVYSHIRHLHEVAKLPFNEEGYTRIKLERFFDENDFPFLLKLRAMSDDALIKDYKRKAALALNNANSDSETDEEELSIFFAYDNELYKRGLEVVIEELDLASESDEVSSLESDDPLDILSESDASSDEESHFSVDIDSDEEAYYDSDDNSEMDCAAQ